MQRFARAPRSVAPRLSAARRGRALSIAARPPGTEEEGVFAGEISAKLGRNFEVTLDDGRIVKSKSAGRLAHGDKRTPLKIGHRVHVQYSLDMDEEDQIPLITGRIAAVVLEPQPGHRTRAEVVAHAARRKGKR